MNGNRVGEYLDPKLCQSGSNTFAQKAQIPQTVDTVVKT
jgi:hypothetical protein